MVCSIITNKDLSISKRQFDPILKTKYLLARIHTTYSKLTVVSFWFKRAEIKSIYCFKLTIRHREFGPKFQSQFITWQLKLAQNKWRCWKLLKYSTKNADLAPLAKLVLLRVPESKKKHLFIGRHVPMAYRSIALKTLAVTQFSRLQPSVV